jgi:ATP-dependent Clp protease ATP-binding subunit ClpB
MNIQKYTEKAQEAVIGAQSLADREGHPEITPEHLLLALVEQQGGIVPEILRKMNIDPARVATAVRGELGRNPRAHGGSQPTLSARLRQVTTAAEAEAERLKDEFVSTEHLLIALASESGRGGPSVRVLQQNGG